MRARAWAMRRGPTGRCSRAQIAVRAGRRSVRARRRRCGRSRLWDAQTGLAAGDGGALLKTTNGGLSWHALTSGTTAALRALAMLDALTSFAAGDGGVLLKTSNGGLSWTALTSGTALALRALRFVDAQTGFAAGDGGVVLKTTNGGTSWAPLTSGTAAALRALRSSMRRRATRPATTAPSSRRRTAARELEHPDHRRAWRALRAGLPARRPARHGGGRGRPGAAYDRRRHLVDAGELGYQRDAARRDDASRLDDGRGRGGQRHGRAPHPALGALNPL